MRNLKGIFLTWGFQNRLSLINFRDQPVFRAFVFLKKMYFLMKSFFVLYCVEGQKGRVLNPASFTSLLFTTRLFGALPWAKEFHNNRA